MSEKEQKAAPPASISHVVCDGLYLYASFSDGSLWFSPLQFPLSWRMIIDLPQKQNITSIGVTLGAVKTLPDEVLFAVTDGGILYFWNGQNWRQEWP